MKMNIEYDKANPTSIEAYAKKLIGMTFRRVYESDTVMEDESQVENKKHKGNLGDLIEEHWFHYKCNSDSRPDFPEAGVELKVTPYKYNKNGTVSAKERLILTMIDYFAVVNEEQLETSHLWTKARLILLIYYLYTKDIKINLDYQINYAKLFSPPEQDKRIIANDYAIIVNKIKLGKAHELSEGDTLYLGAATKAATSKDRRKQPFSEELAKPRAFSFKTSYMTYVLNNYIIGDKTTYEPIVKGNVVDSFEDYVVSKVGKYKGYSTDELIAEFNIEFEKKPKNLESMLAFRILGVKGNTSEEFEKAGVQVKTIRVGKNNKIKENMSFPTFKFKELVEETWEDSTFGNYLRETRFLFIVYKFDENDVLRLQGCQFWNIPYEDLEVEVKSVWERTVEVLNEGLEITEVNGRTLNNFPKQTENRVSHVRPHAQNKQDTYELPDGRQFPKQCFWLNNSYILSQLDERLYL